METENLKLPSLNGFHLAAAVLNEFVLDSLMPFPPGSTGSDQRESIRDDCQRGFKKGYLRLRLKARQRALNALACKEALIKALAVNRNQFGDDCTQILEHFASGTELPALDPANTACNDNYSSLSATIKNH